METQVVEPEGKAIRVFLYGSLKQGQYNHKRFGLDKGARFLGTTSIPKFRLFHNDIFPAAVPDENSKFSLMGEIYDLPPALFLQLERMERGAGYTEIIVETPLGPSFIFVQTEAPRWWAQVKPRDGNTTMINWDPSVSERKDS